MRTAALKCLAWMALLLVPATSATAEPANAYWASEPGTLALALGGLAAMRVARLRRKRPVIFPLFERDSG